MSDLRDGEVLLVEAATGQVVRGDAQAARYTVGIVRVERQGPTYSCPARSRRTPAHPPRCW